LAELGTELEYFHASENAQPVRNQVFDAIKRNLAGVRVDALVAEKRKTGPALQSKEVFYPRMIGYLLKFVLSKHDLSLFKEVLIYTDAIPIRRKRKTIEKIIKTTLASQLPPTARYRLIHHESKSNLDLQIADYCTWALYRKWNADDDRSCQHIRPIVASEFDIFRTGTNFYY